MKIIKIVNIVYQTLQFGKLCSNILGAFVISTFTRTRDSIFLNTCLCLWSRIHCCLIHHLVLLQFGR